MPQEWGRGAGDGLEGDPWQPGPQSTWSLSVWGDVSPPCWLHRPTGFSTELLLFGNIDRHCVWLFLDEVFLSLLFAVSY